jgi:hypothetical protein
MNKFIEFEYHTKLGKYDIIYMLRGTVIKIGKRISTIELDNGSQTLLKRSKIKVYTKNLEKFKW